MTTFVSVRPWATLVLVLALGVPGAWLAISQVAVHPLIAVVAYGAGILAGAFLFSWAAEVAELDISASLAIAILALLTVLPEYAIEAVLAWDAGASFDTQTRELTDETRRVAANVTGANRLLIGVGWPLVILISWLVHRRALDVRGQVGAEMAFLTIAVLLTIVVFFMQGVHFLLAASLLAVYLAYLWIGSTRPAEQPALEGLAARLGVLPPAWRRVSVVVMFLYAAAVILVCADPFVEELVQTGQALGIDEFILIQWIAPLASETPEMVVAALLASRANPGAGLAVLIASEVNKFTLLVGSMVGIFSLSAGELLTFPLDSRQAAEFLLTSAYALFGLLLIARGTVGWFPGVVLLLTFIAHMFFPHEDHRLWTAVAFFGLAGLLVIQDWRRLRSLIRPEPADRAAP